MSFLCVGDDGGTISFETPSMTDPETTYEVHLERATCRLYCSCPSSVFGGRIGHLERPSEGCKHIQAWHKALKELS